MITQNKIPNRRYDAVIFDLDGTLLNTLEDLQDAVNHVLQNHGYPPRSMEEIQSFVGNGIYQLIKRAVPDHISETNLKLVFEEFKSYYTSHCMGKTRPYDGIIELLHYLKDNEYKIAIVSNKNHVAVNELVNVHFPGLIDVAIGQREGIPIKPAPDNIYEVIKFLKIEGKKVIYVGDSEVDKATAENASLEYVLVDWGFRRRDQLERLKPRKIISQSNQLIECL